MNPANPRTTDKPWCKFAESLPLRMGVGRRDWTRTNDPHHVKVVL